ncbi:MAG: tryptophan synthase subunit alpha [Synergistaceae bacterium]|nr:tryptophan synthase subunit alpha [Synergistaceae bacterium]
MSNKISEAFKRGKAFIPYIACGDPDLETTKLIIEEMATSGADLIELGIPFSDPTAEGPVIPQSSLRALASGATTDKIFELVSSLNISTPLIFMTYANVVFSYGKEKFLSRCEELGIAGLILPDVPYEESGEFKEICRAHRVDLISMIAPTSEQRIAKIAGDAEGFIYIVSSLGVTGVSSEISTDICAIVKTIRASSNKPCAVGFGISTPEQAEKMARYADGVIVGSAIVKIIAEHGRDAVKPVGDYVRCMKEAVSKII